MIKKFLSLGLLALVVLSARSYAASFDQLNISINNTSTNDCTLQKQIILYGHVSDHSQIPDVIFRDQTASFTMRSTRISVASPYHKSILLTYACADNQEVTIFIDDLSAFVYGKVIELKNMAVNFTKQNSSAFYRSTPATISWTLSSLSST